MESERDNFGETGSAGCRGGRAWEKWGDAAQRVQTSRDKIQKVWGSRVQQATVASNTVTYI